MYAVSPHERERKIEGEGGIAVLSYLYTDMSSVCVCVSNMLPARAE